MPKPMAHGISVFSLTTLMIEARSVFISLLVPVTPRLETIYKKIYGFDSEKTAKICMEMGQIYDLWNNLNDAIEYYNNSYKIWEKIITDDNYEVLFQLAILLSELYAKVDKGEDAYQPLIHNSSKFTHRDNQEFIKKHN